MQKEINVKMLNLFFPVLQIKCQKPSLITLLGDEFLGRKMVKSCGIKKCCIHNQIKVIRYKISQYYM